MPTTARRLLVAIAAIELAAMPLAGAGAAQARTVAVSPGDELYAAHDHGGSRCTLGYTLTDPGTYITYGITAGHCNNPRSSYVVDRTTGAIGHFVLTVVTPDEPLDDDYGLIDFGSNRSIRTMYGMPVESISTPDAHDAVCHDGIRTGIACGSLDSRLIATQYLTSGMPQSIPGDSGGPVWQPSGNGATVIGIWLGEHIEANGTYYGRFISLTDILVNVAAKTHAA